MSWYYVNLFYLSLTYKKSIQWIFRAFLDVKKDLKQDSFKITYGNAPFIPR